MEDDLNFLTKWKTTSIFFIKIEDDLNFQQNGRQPNFVNKMEDDLNFLQSGRQPQFF